MVAKIFLASNAIGTHAVHVMQPGNADAGSLGKPAGVFPSFLDEANDLMSRDDRRLAGRQLPFNNMLIRAAYSTVAHANQDLTGSRSRRLNFSELERIRFDGSGAL